MQRCYSASPDVATYCSRRQIRYQIGVVLEIIQSVSPTIISSPMHAGEALIPSIPTYCTTINKIKFYLEVFVMFAVWKMILSELKKYFVWTKEKVMFFNLSRMSVGSSSIKILFLIKTKWLMLICNIRQCLCCNLYREVKITGDRGE